MRIVVAVMLLLALLVCAKAGTRESARSPPIADDAGLDRYLADVAPGKSPLDRLSGPAKRRFLTSFREGGLSVADLAAELTHEEALAVLALFGYERFVPAHSRKTHVSIGNSETPAASAHFDAIERAYGAGARDLVAAEYAEAYAPQQTESTLRTLSDGDLALVFRATLIDFDLGGAASPHDLALDFGELERRGVAAPAWFHDAFRVLVTRREFALARDFRERHAALDLPQVPGVRDETSGAGPTVLALGDDGTLVRHTLLLDPHAQVVVVAGCHFSKDAAIDIENDAMLRKLFSRNVVWITPASEDPADPELARWNREHPLAAMTTVYRESEWPEIDSWAIPTFYFLRDGHVVDKVTAWRGQRDAVVAGFRTIGLAPPAP
jgi:hypothetical protein